MGLVLGLTPADLRAQTPPEASGEDKAKAKVYFERAETLKHSGSARAQTGDTAGARAAYAEAATMYLRAFRLFAHPAFVYNAAQMHRLTGETDTAIREYERYLELDPEGAKAQEARAHITQLRLAATARPAAIEAPTAQGDAASEGDEDAEGDEDDEDAEADEGDEDGEDADASAGEDGEAGEDAGAAAADAAAAPAAAGLDDLDDIDGEDKANDRGRPMRIAGLATAGAGALGFLIGVKYGLDARAISDELSEPRYMWTPADRERFAEGESAERTAFVWMGIGGAALVTGGVLYLVGRNQGSDSDEVATKRLAVSASATSDGVSMLLWGRF